MARRKRVEAPSEEQMSELEAQYRQDDAGRTAPPGGLSPIAQVAAEAAAVRSVEPQEQREARARDAADADRYRSAADAGRVMVDLPLDSIDADALTRDRMVLDQADLDELRRSILDHGLRLPIEVYAKDGGEYGLISGYRRLKAVRSIRGDLGFPGYDTIRAVVRNPDEMGGAVVAMVEENEVRSQLSHYERGRIAVIAAQDGAFSSTEEAVATLFASASKGKRSKIRSFALIHEELGDLLGHGERISERDGLRIAGMLRQGGKEQLHKALQDGPAETFETEWKIIEPVLRVHERHMVKADGAGGMPARTAPRRPRGQGVYEHADSENLSSDIRLDRRRVEGGYALTITGPRVDDEMMEALMRQVRIFLSNS